MRNSSYTTLHLTHPRPVSWSSIFQHFATSLRVDLVPLHEWFSRLEASAYSASDEAQVEMFKKNPALLLLDTYRGYVGYAESSAAAPDKDAVGLPSLETAKAVEVAPSLREENLAELGKEDVERWMSYWRKNGFIHST